MKKFRLPRKTKKKLSNGFWLYPAAEDGSSQMAFPKKSQEDYTAIKNGIVEDHFRKKGRAAERKERMKQLKAPIEVSDETLKSYIDNMIRTDLRTSSYNTLIAAKNHPVARVAYYEFVNAYHWNQEGDEDFGNTCCMAIDYAQALLKKHRKPKRYKSKKW